MSRPKPIPPSHLKDPPPDAAQRIRELAATGYQVVGIARKLDTTAKTLRRWLDENHDLKEAFDAGREEERRTLHNVLYTLATVQKDKVAAMFLLKARHGYREGDQSEQGTGPSVIINLPGAMPLERFVTIQNEPDASTEPLPDAATFTPRRG